MIDIQEVTPVTITQKFPEGYFEKQDKEVFDFLSSIKYKWSNNNKESVYRTFRGTIIGLDNEKYKVWVTIYVDFTMESFFGVIIDVMVWGNNDRGAIRVKELPKEVRYKVMDLVKIIDTKITKLNLPTINPIPNMYALASNFRYYTKGWAVFKVDKHLSKFISVFKKTFNFTQDIKKAGFDSQKVVDTRRKRV